jgi:2-haloacid dehalogenase
VIRACFFDVFGTVDWVEFAEEWRKLYNPAMEEVRSGRRDWTILDVLHREGLMTLLDRYDLVEEFDEGEIDHMNRAWHRLDPWPDSVPGLLRLKTRYVIAPCSNGNIALIVNMAKRAGLPWDVVLGAEPDFEDLASQLAC